MRLLASTLLVLALSLCATPSAWSQEAQEVGTDVTVEMINGDRITGRLIEQTASYIVVESEFVGLIRIRRESIKTPEPEPEPPAEVVELKSPWSGAFDLSFSGKRGNTQEQDAFVELQARRETDKTIDTYRGTYERNLTETGSGKTKTTSTTDRRVTLDARREWFLEDTKWRPFLRGYMDDDKFKSWKRRYRVSAGLGYPWIENDKERWIGRFGLAGKKDKSGTDTDWKGEGVFGMEYFLQVTEAQSLSASSDYYPRFESGEGYQLITRGEYRLKVMAGAPWTIKVGAEQDRESNPGAGDSKNDLTYYFAAGFVF